MAVTPNISTTVETLVATAVTPNISTTVEAVQPPVAKPAPNVSTTVETLLQ